MLVRRVMIAIPSNTGRDNFPVPFAMSLIHACREIPKNIDIEIHTFGGLRIDSVRNCAVMYARNHKFDAILFLDDDNTFPPDAFVKLIKHWESGIKVISGVYTSKAPPYHAFIYPTDAKDWLREYDATKLYKVKAIATGCILIDLTVFDKLPMPWFLLRMDRTGTQLTCTEDCYFGLCCFKIGIEMIVDASILCQHLKLCAFPAFFDNPEHHYDGEWREKTHIEIPHYEENTPANIPLPKMKGPLIIHPCEDFTWHDGIDQCAHQHQFPTPVNNGEKQLYRCLDCGLISDGEDRPGSNILDPRIMAPKEIKENIKVLEDLDIDMRGINDE